MDQTLNILEVFYVTLWATTIFMCWRVGTTNTLLASGFLSAIFAVFWDPVLFDQPSQMVSFHLIILLVMIATPKNVFWRLFFSIVMLMAILDTIWMSMPEIEPWLRTVLPEMPYLFPYNVFWWQSAILILFCMLCFITLVWCKLTHKVNNRDRGNGDGYIWAFVGDLVSRTKIH